jgi:RND family efflux transporter MFP subunit
MTDIAHSTVPPSPPAGESSPNPQPGATRRGVVGYVAIAIVAVAVGAGAMFAALRWHAGAGASPAAPDHSAHAAAAPASTGVEPDPEGPGVYVSPARQQLIGVRTAVVSTRNVAGTIRATGTLAYDETKVTQVHTKIAGWIEQVFADFVGKPVQKGQPLFTIYSPDLVATQNEYLLARKAQDQLGASRFEETRQGASSLLAAARKRLELWDISPAQIAELERTGEARKTLMVYAPATGVVLERNAFSGQYIAPETSAFKLADTSSVWAIGQVVESELAQVRLGQTVSVDLSNAPGSRPLAGRVTFIYPDIDPATRRGRIRAEIPNPAFALKPDMFVTLTIQGGASQSLAVPAEAVIDTGVKQYVILAKGRGYFEPRVIQTGPPAMDYYPVISGLAAGDEVVTSAQFLIDSESNLQAAMQAMTDMPGMEPKTSGAGAAARAPVAIDFRTQPDTARVGENAFEVVVKDSLGKPVTDAAVSVAFFMPAMPAMSMPAMRTTSTLRHAGDGIYRGSGQVPMPGRWEVTVVVARGSERLGSKRAPVVVQ